MFFLVGLGKASLSAHRGGGAAELNQRTTPNLAPMVPASGLLRSSVLSGECISDKLPLD